MAYLSNINTRQSNVIFTSFAKDASLQKQLTSNADFTMNAATNFELPPNDSTQLLLMTTAKDFEGVFNGLRTWSFARAAVYDPAFINAITRPVTLNYVVAIFCLQIIKEGGAPSSRQFEFFNCPYILRVDIDPGQPTMESPVKAYVYSWRTPQYASSSSLGNESEIAYPPTQQSLAAAVVNCINIPIATTVFLPLTTDITPPNVTFRFNVAPNNNWTVLNMGWSGGRLASYYANVTGGSPAYIVNEAIQNTIQPLAFPDNLAPPRDVIAFRNLAPQLSYPPDTRFFAVFSPIFGKYPLQGTNLSNLGVTANCTQIRPQVLSNTFSTFTTAPAWEMPLINANLCVVGLPLPTTPQPQFNTKIFFPPGGAYFANVPFPRPTIVQYFAPDYVQCYRLTTLVTSFTPINDLYPSDARHPRYGFLTPSIVSDSSYQWLPPRIPNPLDIYSRSGSVCPPPWRNISYESPYSNACDSLFTVARRFETLRFTLKPMFAPFAAQMDADDELEMTFGFLSLAGAKNQAYGRTYRKRR